MAEQLSFRGIGWLDKCPCRGLVRRCCTLTLTNQTQEARVYSHEGPMAAHSPSSCWSVSLDVLVPPTFGKYGPALFRPAARYR
eukprot:947538-Prorocentrum_minimum.AAC.2